MKTKIIEILVIGIVICFSPGSLHAQTYKRAFGFKLGGYSGYLGLGYKEFLNPRISIENSFSISPKKLNRKLSFQTLVQVNQVVGDDKKLMLYGGIGPCLIFFTQTNKALPNDIRGAQNTGKSTLLCINTFFGAEHQIDRSPLHLSFDMGPSVFLVPKFTVKYMINISFKYVVRHTDFKPHFTLKKSAYSKKREQF